jgi:hypothetical protein
LPKVRRGGAALELVGQVRLTSGFGRLEPRGRAIFALVNQE